MPPCLEELFVQLMKKLREVDPEDMDHDALLDQVRSLEVVQRSWTDFQTFLRNLKEEALWTELSACMELSLGAEEPRWHFHVVFSNVRQMRSGDRFAGVVLPKEGVQGFAPKPDIRLCCARGRSAEVAIQRLHCYCQWPKVGSVFTQTNYQRGWEFVCRANWTMAIWQVRKLSYRAARQEIVRNRDAVEKSMALMQAVFDAEVMEYMKEQKACALRLAEGRLKNFKYNFKVECWKAKFQESVFHGGMATRFPFLVLEGDSKFGKTRYASSLWGIQKTFVSQCQGVCQPSLAGYDPRVHKAIVLDEPSRDLVNRCKVLLQASLEGTELYQSPTQRFTRWVWVYAVPIIICTNEWLKDQDVDANAQWIRANSVHVRATDYMWER